MKAIDNGKVFFDKEIKKKFFNKLFVLHFTIEGNRNNRGSNTENEVEDDADYSEYYRGMTRWQTL